MEAVKSSESPHNPFATVQDLLSQSQQFWQERAAQSAEDFLELYKAGLEYSNQITSLTLDAARRSFDSMTPKT